MAAIRDADPAPLSTRIGHAIRSLRQARGLTLEQVGERVGYLSRDQVSKIELGAPRTTVEQFEDISRALGTKFSRLLDSLSTPSADPGSGKRPGGPATPGQGLRRPSRLAHRVHARRIARPATGA